MWKKTVLLIIIIFLILIIVPVILVRNLFQDNKNHDLVLNIYNHNKNEIVRMELEEYLRGVLAAEMPALYHPEALKAQAVAARTYTLKQLPQFGGPGSQKYKGADLSTDYTDCQAFLTESEMKEKWGFIPFFYYWSRINSAVEETRGQILLYNGQLIDAVYHANSGGKTEDAEYVWGRVTPYLKSKESPYDRENEKSYHSIHYFSLEELLKRFSIKNEEIAVNRSNNIVEIIKLSPAGRILELKIGNQIFSGIEVRENLILPSTKLVILLEGDNYSFSCYGKGHGVGMSQDGANGFAKQGYNYQQILKYYYSDVEIGTSF